MKIRHAKKPDFKDLSKLLLKMFEEYLSPYFTKDGAAKFKKYMLSEESFVRRTSNLMFIAEEQNKLIGFLESDKNDIKLFFVEKRYHGQGIGKSLMNKLENSLKNLGFKAIYVPASPQAVPIYLSLGFKKTTGLRTKIGGHYQPMKKILTK